MQLLRRACFLLLSLLLFLEAVAPPLYAQETSGPHLAVGTGIATHTGSVVEVPIYFTGNGHSINAAAFAIEYDPSHLTLTAPADVIFHLPDTFSKRAFVQEGQAGKLNVSIYTFARIGIPDGRLATVPFTASCPADADPATVITETVRFATSPRASFGNVGGADVPGSTADGTVTIDCTPIPPNTPPTAIDDNATVDEDRSLSIPVLDNDGDADGDAISIVEVNDAANGSTALQNKQIRYTPNPNFHGSDFFAYTIADAEGATATALVTVVVNPVNDDPVAMADGVSTDEDRPITFDVRANDIDVDGDALAVTVRRTPQHGEITVAADGLITYAPAPNVHGADSFTYRIDDGQGERSEAEVTISVRPVNDAPVAADDAARTAEDRSLLVPVLANDADVDGDTLRIVGVGAPQHGAVSVEAGQIRYRPAANFFGEDTFRYTVSDGMGGFATANIAVAVDPVNDPPQAEDVDATTDEDLPVVVAIVAADADGDGLSLRVVTFPAWGTATVGAAQTLLYTPTLNFHGVDSVRFAVADGQGGEATATATIEVRPLNDPPVAADDAAVVEVNTTVIVDVLANDADPDGDALTVGALSDPTGGAVQINDDGTLTYTPDAGFAGVDSFTYGAVDPDGSASPATVTVIVRSDADNNVSAKADKIRIAEDTPTLIHVLANDKAKQGTLQLLAVTQPQRGTATLLDGQIRYTPHRNAFGSDSFVYTVGDGAQGVDQATVTVDVRAINDPPTAVDDRATTGEESWVNIDVLFNDGDVDGDALSIAEFGQGQHGLVRLRKVSGSRSTLRYLPNPGFSGVDSFAYWTSDGNGGLATANVIVTVEAVNKPPLAVDDAVSTDEDVPFTIAVLDNDSDPEGDALALLTVGAATLGEVTDNGDGTLTYAPLPDHNGVDEFVYTIGDGGGGEDSATVTVLIFPVDDAPQPVGDAAITEGNTPVSMSPLANDLNNDEANLTISGYGQPSNGSVVLNADGTFTYTPNPDFSGSDSFEYTLGEDAPTGRQRAAQTARVTVIVDPEPGRVSAVADAAATDEDTPVTIPVLDNDGADTLTLVGVDAPQKGRVRINGDGTITYTPRPNVHGEETFRYAVSDGGSGADWGAVTVTIRPINDRPRAADDAVVTAEDSPVTISPLLNDSDADGDALSLASVAQPRHGTVTVDGEQIRYTPAPNFNGVDRILYTVDDGAGGQNWGVVRVTVTAVNDAPDVAEDRGAVDEDGQLTLWPLRNDFDPDGDTLSVLGVTPPQHGLATVSGEGQLIYTPTANYHGADQVSYVAGDGVLTTTTTVQIAVNPVNDPPQATDDQAVVASHDTVTLDLLANDLDVDGDEIFIRAVGIASGMLTQTEDGILYVPAPGIDSVDTFTYTVSDGLLEDTATVEIRISDVAAAAAEIATQPGAESILRPGETITYSVRVENVGGVPLTDVGVIGDLPPSTTIVGMSMGVHNRSLADGLRWHLNRLEANETMQVDLTLQLDAAIRTSPRLDLSVSSDQTVMQPLTSALHRLDPLDPLTRFDAVRVDGAVELTWHTGSETVTAGFVIWRGEGDDWGSAVRLTETMLPAHGEDGADYHFVDSTAQPGQSYFYWIEEIKDDGYRHRHAPLQLDPPGGQGNKPTSLYLPAIFSGERVQGTGAYLFYLPALMLMQP